MIFPQYFHFSCFFLPTRHLQDEISGPVTSKQVSTCPKMQARTRQTWHGLLRALFPPAYRRHQHRPSPNTDTAAEGIRRAHLVEQLHKTGPSPWQVRADLRGKAGGFPASPGRGAGKSSARAQRCGMPAPAPTCSLPGLRTGSGLLLLPRAGGDKQGARGVSILFPALVREESSEH